MRHAGARRLRGMRFAIKTSPQDTTWADMLAVWQAADEIELFESAWTFDHFYPIFTEQIDGDCMEGWITLAALAQATRRLRVGVLVTGLPYRHPAVLANMAATLDIVSGGRLELGIGAGLERGGGEAYGIDLHADAHRALRRVRRGVRGDHRPAHERADHLRRSLRAAHRRVLQPEAGPAAAPADLHRRSGRAPHAALGGALRAALELPGWSGRAVRGEARRAARALRRPRTRPVGDHGVDAPARRPGSEGVDDVVEQAKRYGDAGSTSASCTCSRRTHRRARRLAAALARAADELARVRCRGSRASSPRPCAPRTWGRSGSASGSRVGTHFLPHSAVIASPVM